MLSELRMKYFIITLCILSFLSLSGPLLGELYCMQTHEGMANKNDIENCQDYI